MAILVSIIILQFPASKATEREREKEREEKEGVRDVGRTLRIKYVNWGGGDLSLANDLIIHNYCNKDISSVNVYAYVICVMAGPLVYFLKKLIISVVG